MLQARIERIVPGDSHPCIPGDVLVYQPSNARIDEYSGETALSDHGSRRGTPRCDHADALPGRLMRIGFLLNHYETHQVPHVAPTAFALSRLKPGWHVEVMCSTVAEAEFAREIGVHYPGSSALVSYLHVPALTRLVDPIVRQVKFNRKFAVQRANIGRFASFDALVVPEMTSLSLRKDRRMDGVRLIFTGHGAGDSYGKSVGMFDPRIDQFDLVLLPGPRIADELRTLGRLADTPYAVVGYPKLELATAVPRRRFFCNTRPTVLYNPTQTPAASSWYRFGPAVLDHFQRSEDYNLIFAPHVLLFKRSWRRGARLPRQFKSTEMMLIDRGSRASVDLTYLMAADIYLGDLSSQVYEFISRPRPCVFIDPLCVDYRGNPAFRTWSFGPVIRDVADLGKALASAVRDFEQYRPVQEEARDRNFAPSATPASTRSAAAIASYMEHGTVSAAA
jgi:hypothetical protein